jgi:hypothetical protein
MNAAHPCQHRNAPDAACRVSRPAPNRCALCGRFVGEKFTGYSRDRLSNRGRLLCDSCLCTVERKEGKR